MPYETQRFTKARRVIAKHSNGRFLGRTFTAACRIDDDRQDAHPCHIKSKNDPSANPIVLGKIYFCDGFFDGPGAWHEENHARLVVHETMHWLKIPKSAWWVSGGCKDWNHNRKVIHNDS